MPPAGATGKREPRPRYDVRRDEILDIAVAAFRRRGFAGTSMQDIGRALERTKGSLYYYFPDKEEILFDCHDRALDRIFQMAREVRGASRDPSERLRGLIEGHVALMVHEFHGTALALELSALGGRRLASVVRRRDKYEQILRNVIRDGVRAGAFRPVDPKLSAFAILGSINWIARWYRPRGSAGAEAIGKSFADLHLRALLRHPPSGSADRPSGAARF
jgi:AcrR family transcriptional regulator